jgi:protein deglycase
MKGSVMKKQAVIILAKGFEEVEAFTPIDILRRCGINLTVAGLGAELVEGAHGARVRTDIVFEKYDASPDVIILPGGMPGAENLASSTKVKDLIMNLNSERRIIAAICASPALVLAPAGVLKGKRATCYPGMEKSFPSDVKFFNGEVVQDGNIITSMGPATAFAFGLKIAENIVGKSTADMVGKQMLYYG